MIDARATEIDRVGATDAHPHDKYIVPFLLKCTDIVGVPFCHSSVPRSRPITPSFLIMSFGLWIVIWITDRCPQWIGAAFPRHSGTR